MASTISGQAIISPDLTNSALLADMQWLEPYASAGLNRKLRNILLPGIYNGFDVIPGTAPGGQLAVTVTSPASTGGGASVNISDRYQVSIQQLKNVTVPFAQSSNPSNYVMIILEGNYDMTNPTDQVNVGSKYPAARVFAQVTDLNFSYALKPNQLELARLTISRGTTQIIASMIDKSHRIMRRIGLQLTDSITLNDSTIGGSAAAIFKLKGEIDKFTSASMQQAWIDMGIGQKSVTLRQKFNWQTAEFHGDEYIYINWADSLGNPSSIDYPPGYYQISVIGLSNVDYPSLMIRPMNYNQPLAPYMISWTGSSPRLFRARVVMTALGDINDLANIGPNNLTLQCHSGIYSQPDRTKATSQQGYPIAEPGTLRVEPSAKGTANARGVMQTYTSATTGRMFVRGMANNGTFAGWREIPNLSNNLLLTGGHVNGIAAESANSVYLANGAATLGAFSAGSLVNATVYEYNNHKVRSGIRRDTTTGVQSYSVDFDGTERIRITPGGNIWALGGQLASCAATPSVSLKNVGGTLELGFINVSNAILNIHNADGSNLALSKFGMVNAGTPTGATGAILAGSVQGDGTVGNWTGRSAGLFIKLNAASQYHNVWKAALNGTNAAAMSVLYAAAKSQAVMSVGGKNFTFDSAGVLTSETVYATSLLAVGDNDSGLKSKADGQVSLWANSKEIGYWTTAKLHINVAGEFDGAVTAGSQVNIKAAANKHLFFQNMAGVEKGLIYVSDAGVMNFRTNGSGNDAKRMILDASGNLKVGAQLTSLSHMNIQLNGDKYLFFRDAGGVEKALIYSNDAGNLYLRANKNKAITIAATGAVSFPGGNLTGINDITCHDVSVASDRTIKREFKRHENVLTKLQKITGFLYEIRDPEGNWKNSAGVVAQDVQEVFPDLVREDGEGILRMNYNGLIGVLVDAVNALARGEVINGNQ
ncbi:TPA: pyocin knob domain-containing S74 family peptidase [Enterobacter cloacae]